MGKANIMDIMREKSKKNPEKMEIVYKDIEALEPSDKNFYSMANIEALKNSIAALGILQPLLISAENGRDIIKSGHRRRMAVLELLKESGNEKLRQVPCIYVKDWQPDKETASVAQQIVLIQANNFREKTEYEKMVEVIQMEELVTALKKSEKIPGRTRDLLKEATGIKPNKLAQYHKIANNLIPEIMDYFRQDMLSISHVDRLASLTREHQQEAMASALDCKEVERLEALEKSERENNLPGQMEITEIMPKPAEHPKKPEITDFGTVSGVEELKEKVRGNGGCITGFSPYGNCVCCGLGGVKCCGQCEKGCNSRCGWLPEKPEQKPEIPEQKPEKPERQPEIPERQQLREIYDSLPRYVKYIAEAGDVAVLTSSLYNNLGVTKICSGNINIITDRRGVVFNPETPSESQLTWQQVAEKLAAKKPPKEPPKIADIRNVSDSDTLCAREQIPHFYRYIEPELKTMVKEGERQQLAARLRGTFKNSAHVSDTLEFSGQFDGIVFNSLTNYPEKMTWNALAVLLIQWYAEKGCQEEETHENAAETHGNAAKTQQENSQGIEEPEITYTAEHVRVLLEAEEGDLRLYEQIEREETPLPESTVRAKKIMVDAIRALLEKMEG